MNRVWIVFVAAGPAYALAGVFDNRMDALKCVATFKNKFAYAQSAVMGEQLASPLSMARLDWLEEAPAR